MSANSDFFLARAAECAREAADSDLVNVRERFLRSEAAWLAMAEKVQSTEAARDKAAVDKAQLAAEAERDAAALSAAAQI